MNMKTIFGLGAFVIVALLVAGIAYWIFGENSPAPSESTGAPPAAPQAIAPPGSPASPSSSTTSPPSQAAAPSTPPPGAPSSPPATAQSNQSAASPAPSAATPPPTEQGQAGAPPAGTPAAPTATLPAEDQMSEADRRQVQEMLRGLNYYQGPIDGKFGPLTRSAIRRFQDSIGAKSTGYLAAAEANRLVSTH
jgi:hypothetical protein